MSSREINLLLEPFWWLSYLLGFLIITISWIVFLLGSMAIVIVSKGSLLHPITHGFYLFFASEVPLVMLSSNMTGWFYDLLAWHQIVSWLLLIVFSFLLVSWG